jgi:hypothetical protein
VLTLQTLRFGNADLLTSSLQCLKSLSRAELENLGIRFINILMAERLKDGPSAPLLAKSIEHYDPNVVILVSTFILHLAEVEDFRQEIASSRLVIKALESVNR